MWLYVITFVVFILVVMFIDYRSYSDEYYVSPYDRKPNPYKEKNIYEKEVDTYSE